MSPLIARRYKPHHAAHTVGAPGATIDVTDTQRGAPVVLRVLSDASDPSGHWLLQLRAGALARLRHPALQTIHGTDHLPDGSLFVVEAPPRGRAVTQLMPLPPERVSDVILGVCQALRALHGRGFAHGELAADRLSLDAGFRPTLSHGLRLGLGARTQDDLIALGRLFFHVLAGRPPAPGETLPGRSASNVPPHLDSLVHHLLTGACETLDDAFTLLPLGERETVPLPLGEAPLVGRDDELTALNEAWHGTQSSRHGRVMAVVGASGMGKTRLLEEATLGWRLGGAAVLVGQASADDVPYRPWDEIIRQAVPLARQRCPEILAAAAPALQSLLGDLGVQAAPALEPRQEKLRLQGAMADLLGALAQSGLIVVLEDWAGADALSREALAAVARLCGDRPLLVLLGGTADADAEPDSAVGVLSLAPMPRWALGHLCQDLLGGRPLTESALDAMEGACGGNPRLAKGLLAQLAEAGHIQPTHDGWAISGDLSGQPRTLHDLYRARLDRLDAPTREAAQMAAVQGIDGEMALLKALWPHGEPTLAPALDALVAQGVLQASGAAYRFESPEWVALIKADVPEPTWRAWHDQTADALRAEADAGRAPADWVLRHAGHALAGTDAERAIAAALAAGQYHLSFNAPIAARRFLDTGLTLWQADGGPDGAKAALELPFRQLLADVLRMSGEYEQAIALYQRAGELAEAHGRTELRAYMLTSAGKCLQMRNAYAEAEGRFEASLGIYAGLDAPAGRLRALNSLARVLMVQGKRAQAEALYIQSLEAAETSGERVAEGEALGALGLNLVSNDPGRIADGIGYLERSVALRKEMGDKIGLNDAYSLLGNAYLTLGQFPTAKAAFVRNQRLCFECGLADDEIFALINLSIVALEMGEFRRARELAATAHAKSVQSGSRFCLSLAMALEGLARAYMADLGEVMALMAGAQAIARELNNQYLEINVLVWHAEALLLFGRLTESVDVAHAATELMEALGYREFEPRLLVFQAEVHGRLSEREEAHALLARAHDLAIENQNAGMVARVLKTMAWLYLQEKNLLLSRDHARQALAAAQGVGAAYLAGEAHWLIGEVDLAAGQLEQATRELLKALAAGEATESPHLQGLALFCLARASDDEFRTREYLFQARDMLMAQLSQLDDTNREDYLSLAERWRVDRGELVFAEKARAQQGQSELGPEGRHYFERLQHFARFAAALHGMALEPAMETLMALMEARRVCALVESPDGHRVVHLATDAHAADAAADRHVLDALRDAQGVFHQPFVTEDARFAGLYPGSPPSLLAVSFGHGVVMAVREGSMFSAQDMAILELVGTQFGVAIANAARLGVKI